jgi:aconitate hydratase
MKKSNEGVFLIKSRKLVLKNSPEYICLRDETSEAELESARKGTIAYSILEAHNVSGDMNNLKLKFDALVAQDMTYMGVLQTAIASGVQEFPMPFVLSSCHNALCYNNGTSNEDDHVFARCAAKKYGGIYLPAHQAVMHQYMREMYAGCGKMILGADSHTRYGALGTLATGEGGGELVKQLLDKTYDINYPETVLVYLTGAPAHGVGPQDIAIALIGQVFNDGFVKNKILEFCGPGIQNLSVDYRNGIDVMTTESSAMFSIWETDQAVKDWLAVHGRADEYKEMKPKDLAYYDSLIEIDLSRIRPMIALPFHPSNAYSIDELNENLEDILYLTEQKCNEQMAQFNLKVDLRSKIVNGKLYVDQGVIAGCAGGLFENITKAVDILRGKTIGSEGFALNIYPASTPILYELMEHNVASDILACGANLRSAFCGPCFGAGDIPANGGFSIRHTTRNFSNREGSRPGIGQMASVALMDSQSIAATAANGGVLTSAAEFDGTFTKYRYYFKSDIYEKRVLNCFKKHDSTVELIKGPGIGDIPEIPELKENLLVKFAAVITDPVTTTDELIPNGESSSYRSNFQKIAEYTLSAKVPEYVGRCKAIQKWQKQIEAGENPFDFSDELQKVREILKNKNIDVPESEICIGSAIYANRPGDGSAREYAASNQKVLGGWINLCRQYATKRYRSNLINWGILPFTYQGELKFSVGSFLWIPNIKSQLISGASKIKAYILSETDIEEIELSLDQLSEKERAVIASGCLINYNKSQL